MKTNQIFHQTMLRDYAIAGVVLMVMIVFGVHSFNRFIDSMRQNVRIETAQIDKTAPAVRNYTVVRSVLDDTVATGSIPSRPVVLDPCTGQVKSR